MTDIVASETIHANKIEVKSQSNTQLVQEMVIGDRTVTQVDDISGFNGSTYSRSAIRESDRGRLSIRHTAYLMNQADNTKAIDVHYETFLDKKMDNGTDLAAHLVKFKSPTGHSSRILWINGMSVPEHRATLTLMDQVNTRTGSISNQRSTELTVSFAEGGLTDQMYRFPFNSQGTVTEVEGGLTDRDYRVSINSEGKVTKMETRTRPHRILSPDHLFQQIEDEEAQRLWKEKIEPTVKLARTAITDDPDGWALVEPERTSLLPLLNPNNFPDKPIATFVANKI